MELIIGPMFSGKSTELIRRIKRLESIGKKVLVINSVHDSRCKKMIQTHDKKNLVALKYEKLDEIKSYKKLDEVDIIAIDEAQFFEDLYDTVLYLTENKKKECIICGLDGDAYQNKFGQIIDLIPKCNKLDKLSGYCNLCNNKTEGQYTIKNKLYSDNQEKVLIGDNNIYLCVCRFHMMQNKNKNKPMELLRNWNWNIINQL